MDFRDAWSNWCRWQQPASHGPQPALLGHGAHRDARLRATARVAQERAAADLASSSDPAVEAPSRSRLRTCEILAAQRFGLPMRKSSLRILDIPSVAAPAARRVEVTRYAPDLPLEQRVSLCEDMQPSLGPGLIRIGLLAMTVHPADLLQIDGRYGVQPPLPYTPGHEGVAIVLSVAPDVDTLKVGDLVVPLAPGGTWRDERVLSSRQVVVLDGDVDVLQCAMLSANPMTAWVLLYGIVALEGPVCLIQNAANSAVGQCVRQLAAQMGIRLINVVRRAEALDGARLGDEHWIIDEGMSVTEFVRRIKALADGRPVPLALDAVAGESTRKLAAAVDVGAKVAVYGLLSQKPSEVMPEDLIFRTVSVEGFWLANWFADPAHRAAAKSAMSALQRLMAEGVLKMAVQQTFDLGQVAGALACAAKPHRTGKVLLTGAWLAHLAEPLGKP